ncbi:polycomb group protein Psc-like [Actinia tenebrosa]|uniref:Polycomb group protein Psc-like n=1 Tax=Actinia tenebrosa TaxID=6105 RepID=A0A6P8J931_ACTTE|nr:polycomb group protein Psc-like [Actinia tenebrosa]XP_031574286.1 polycomb group protein Psc-like [Actinia tenebrosa]XP_031574287.1 polycomb group protein Psc-like [Actinia tenebrosa]XP_031574288.1 polycomb group protein Psc-like [Actinia tenebrosa]
MLRSMKLKSLNPHITCVLCGGYLVDATTIIECLHSFCRSCIVRYLETSFHCPVCDVEIHKTRPLLHIKPDRVLQDIVYKLVPGLSPGLSPGLCFGHSDNKERITPGETGDTAEVKSDQNGCPDVIDDPVCIQLEYYGRKRFQRTEKQIFPTRFLRCSSKVTVGVLKKFLSIKFGIPPTHQPEIVRSDEILDNHITMTELSRIYGLYAKSCLDIQYIFLPNKEDDELKTEGQEAKRVKIDHLQQYRHNELQQLQRKRKGRRRKHQTKEDQQSDMPPPKRRKRRMKNVVLTKAHQDSNERYSLPNGVVTEDVLREKRLFYGPTTQGLAKDSNEPENNDKHHQLVQQLDHQDVNQREQKQDKETTTGYQTTRELQYEKEQQQSTPEDGLSVMEKQHGDYGCYQNRTDETNLQHVDYGCYQTRPEQTNLQHVDHGCYQTRPEQTNLQHGDLGCYQNRPEQTNLQHGDHGCYQNRPEQTNLQQTQKHQSKENETRQHESVCDKAKFYQLNKHFVSVKNSTVETESNKDKESLESLKISPPPLRSRNIDNIDTSCAETFVCPPLWNGIESTAIL